MRPILEGMRRAVDTLRLANSYQDAIQKSTVLRRIDLASFVAKYCENLNARIGGVCAAGVDVPTFVQVDKIHLEQALENLIKNAGRFRFKDSTILMSLRRSDDKVFLSVQNEGPLLPESSFVELFEFGYTSQADTHNRGIGLYVCKVIMEAMSGTIRAENLTTGPKLILVFSRF